VIHYSEDAPDGHRRRVLAAVVGLDDSELLKRVQPGCVSALYLITCGDCGVTGLEFISVKLKEMRRRERWEKREREKASK